MMSLGTAVCRLMSITLLLAIVSAYAEEWRDRAWDDLRQNYGWFTEMLAHQDWEPISNYINEEAIINNDDRGIDALKSALADDRCRKELVHVLAAGCRRAATGTSDGERLICSAPPQQGPDVIYAGASAQFWYDRAQAQWELRYVNCGGT